MDLFRCEILKIGSFGPMVPPPANSPTAFQTIIPVQLIWPGMDHLLACPTLHNSIIIYLQLDLSALPNLMQH